MTLTEQYPILDSLRKFRVWWFTELKSLVPARLSAYFSGSKSRLEVLMEKGVTRLHLTTNKEIHLIAVFDLEHDGEDNSKKLVELQNSLQSDLPKNCEVEVYLPEDKILWRDIVLPSATEDNLASVLNFEIDRLTPFRPDQVSYGYRLTTRFPEYEKIKISLAAVRQDYLDKILDRLKRIGLVAMAVFPPAKFKRYTPTLNMLHPERRARSEPLFNRRAQRFFLLTGLLLLMVFLYPAIQLNQIERNLQSEIDLIRPEATIVGNKQALLATRLAARESLVSRKNREPGKLEIIREITRLIPDNTWVSRLNLDRDYAEIQGESGKASDLIEVLEKSEYFQNVQFGASITRNANTDMEHFEIRMDLTRSKE